MKKIIAVIITVAMLAAILPVFAAVEAGQKASPAHVRLEGYAAADKEGSTYSEWIGFFDDDVTVLDHYDYMISTYAGAYYDGYVYGFIYGYDASSTLHTEFYRVSMRDHGVEFIEGASANGEFVFAMAYNYADGNMYALCNENNPYIATVDLETGALTRVVTISQSDPVSLGLQCMTIDGDGNFYGLSFAAVSSKLVSININTGVCTQLADTGLDTFYAQSMAYDRVNDRIYWAHADNNSRSNNGLYIIDVNNGYELTHLGAIGDNGSDIEVTALYVVEDYVAPAETHTLTINYVDTAGTVLEAPYVGEYEEGETYSVASPSIREYETEMTLVEGVMGTEDVTINVVYTPVTEEPVYHTLTVSYVYEDGSAAAPAYSASVAEGEAYSVESPVVEGYTASVPVVEGVMGTEDVVVTVTYTRNGPAVSLLGDVNCDGKVDMSDISALSAYLLGVGQVTEQGLVNADASLNGAVDSSDLSAIFALV